MDRRRSVSDKPGEPEVIPPGDMRSRGASFDGAQRIYVARISPVGFALMGVMIAVLAAFFFLLLVGAFVVLLPLAGLLLAIIIAVGLFRILIWRRF
jgi:VIT1/CCC1 family predicted Fe2+/Mn2+ transporter